VTNSGEVYLELGAVIFLFGLGGRLAGRAGISPIPIYLIAGLVASRCPTRSRTAHAPCWHRSGT
jgi:Kef-type K+ transport system membrane component KefB